MDQGAKAEEVPSEQLHSVHPFPSVAFRTCSPVTRKDDLGTPPERFRLANAVGAAFAALVTTVAACLVLAVSPVLLIATAARALVFCRVRYRRPPSDLRVAVIGGGWNGVQCVRRLHELGVRNVKGFERHDDVGGTFHPAIRYHGCQIHGGMWITCFKDYAFSKRREVLDGKARADVAFEYIRGFLDHYHIRKDYSFNSNLVIVRYSTVTRTAMLVVEDTRTGTTREEGPFDIVLYMSHNSKGFYPDIPRDGTFTGKELHSHGFSSADFDAIVEQGQHVAVVGGSKSATDMVANFERAGYKNYTWVYRKPYLFWKFERAFQGRGILHMLSGLAMLVGLVLMLVSVSLGGLMWWATGWATTFGPWHNDWSKFHWSVLCPTQRRILEGSFENQRVSGLQKLTKDGLVLGNGAVVQADVVLYATGYLTGIGDLKFEKDGTPVLIDMEANLFNHFIFPTCPVFATGTSLWTTFGPARGTNAAELAVYHLCVRRFMSEKAMQSDAKWNLSRSCADRSLLFDDRYCMLLQWLYMYIDLLLRGIVALEDFLYHGIAVFCFGYQPPVRFNIFPSDADGALPFFVPGTDAGTDDDWLAHANANAFPESE